MLLKTELVWSGKKKDNNVSIEHVITCIEWLQMGFGLVTGFIGLFYLQLVTTSVSTVTPSLPLFGNGFQVSNIGCFPSSWFLNCPHASATAAFGYLTNSMVLVPLHSLTELLASTVDSQLWTELDWTELLLSLRVDCIENTVPLLHRMAIVERVII
jgi:hypothetical protein